MSNQFGFFGTDAFAVIVLDTLKNSGFMPAFAITAPDRKQGRGQKITEPPVKTWAITNGIPVFQPETLDDSFLEKLSAVSKDVPVFVVASYGKILPLSIIDMPERGTLNIHPSLLPKLRGASPIESTILEDEKPGVSIIKLDEKIDHGPIVEQKEVAVPASEMTRTRLEAILAREGGALLADVLPGWISGERQAREQDHLAATFTKKIEKEDGLVDIFGDPSLSYKKIRAYEGWPGAYFFFERDDKKIRVRITKAYLDEASGTLVVERVIPEGRKEMPYEDFVRGFGSKNQS